MSETVMHIEGLFKTLSTEEKLIVFERLAHDLRQSFQATEPQDLYGRWQDKFPHDIDLDKMLDEVRLAWKKEWEREV